MYRIISVLTETQTVYHVQYKFKLLWWTWWVTVHDRKGDYRIFTYLSDAERYIKSKTEEPKVVKTYEVPPKSN